MKTILILGVLLLVAYVLKSCISNNSSQNETRPSNAILPTDKVANDKVVLIENVKLEDVKSALEKFCNSYNQEGYRALPLLTVVAQDQFVVTFPFDLDFETYCYFVNYLYYPHDIIYKPTIKAWTRTSRQDQWMTDDIVNKPVMLYIPSDDQEYDNVYLTTADNIGYKMGFAVGQEKQRLTNPRQQYSEPIALADLEGKETIQFK